MREYGKGGYAFATAALTDDAECPAKVNVEAGAVDGADDYLRR